MTDDQFERIKKGLNFHSEGGVYNLCTLTETTLRTIIEDAVKFYEKQQKIDALHILEIQKQNGELTDELTKKADTNHQLVEQMAELNERCSELEMTVGTLRTFSNEQATCIERLEKENEIFKKANEIIAQQRDGRDVDISIRENRIADLEAQIKKMKCCGNCKYWQFQNDAGYYTCTRDGKRNGKNYRSCEFDLEKWEWR